MPNVTPALTRSRPRGCTAALEAIASASATSSRIARQRSTSAAPLSVSDNRRVERLSSRVPRCASSSLT